MPYSHFASAKAGESKALILNYLADGGKMVMLNSGTTLPNLDYRKLNLPYIQIDDEAGGGIAAARLLEHGCGRYLAWCGISPRLAGFRKFIEAKGKQVEVFPCAGPSLAEIGMIEKILSDGESIGIFCGTDELAVKVHSLLTRHGIAPGGQVKLVGYDNLSVMHCLSPSVTTVEQPFEEMGRQAVELLVKAIYGQPLETVLLSPKLVERESA